MFEIISAANPQMCIGTTVLRRHCDTDAGLHDHVTPFSGR